ncbi:hypothetical protein D3C86_1918660 [compost metagenome]
MHDEDEAFAIALDRQCRLLDTQEPQKIGAGALHEVQVAGVVDDAGKIGVFVIDALHQSMAVFGQFACKRDQGHASLRQEFPKSCAGTKRHLQALQLCHKPILHVTQLSFLIRRTVHEDCDPRR